jgi:hypothetical protein
MNFEAREVSIPESRCAGKICSTTPAEVVGYRRSLCEIARLSLS